MQVSLYTFISLVHNWTIRCPRLFSITKSPHHTSLVKMKV